MAQLKSIGRDYHSYIIFHSVGDEAGGKLNTTNRVTSGSIPAPKKFKWQNEIKRDVQE